MSVSKRQLVFHFILLLWLTISIGEGDEADKVTKSVEVGPDGKVNDNPASMDNTYNRDDLIEKRIEALHAQLLELQTHITEQQDIINDLNDTLTSFVFTAEEYGVIYDKTDDRPLLLTSLHSHSVPFVMLNVISVRLPKRDSFMKNKPKKSKARIGSRSGRKKKAAKTRYVHVIVTLSRDGIFQLWDDEQNELYTYFDSTIFPDNASNDELINSNKNFMVYSDIVTQNRYGNTWFVMARNDASFVKVYAVAAWRDYVDDKVNRKIRKSVIEGQIAPENTIYRPSTDELIKIQQEMKKKKRKQTSIRNKKKDIDVNEFDTESTAAETTELADEECIDEKEEEIKNASVSGVAVYQQQKKQYVIVSYSDGLVFAYKPNGAIASSASTIPYKSPNETIIAISTTRKKYEMIIVTEIGFRFLKLPRLSKAGPFCTLPLDTMINDIQFDVTSTTLMYLATTDGQLIIYNTKKLNKKMCKSLDNFTVHPNSPLKVETIPGYLLITSSLGLHVYNVTQKKGASYIRPGLIFVRKFVVVENEFATNDERLSGSGSNVLISSYTDGKQRTVIAYAQSANNISAEGEDISYKFVVLESYLPKVNNARQDGGGIFAILSKAPIFVGIAMFALFWVFFKGKGSGSGSGGGGFGNSPLGRLGKMFSGTKRRNRFSRGGSGDIRGKKERWDARHGSTSSANMRYGNKKSQTQRKPGFGSSGQSYRRSGGFGADYSD